MERLAVTGGAGFIGSNLAEHFCRKGHTVTIVDNFSTGREENLAGWPPEARERVQLVRSDINDTEALRQAFRGVHFVFHEAAIPSVPRSIDDPAATTRSNISGTLSVLIAARDEGVRRVVFASSSSIYGDDPNLPKQENRTGRPLSPYALSKVVGEEFCRLFLKLYGLETVCLRYFNVFGPRQDPKSEYAAVVPRFATRLIRREPPIVYGDGEQTRDFTFVSNVVDANWVAATHADAAGECFNIGCGTRTSLNQLLREMKSILGVDCQASHLPARTGDVRHSFADVSKAGTVLGYRPAVSLREGLAKVLDWYRDQIGAEHGTA